MADCIGLGLGNLPCLTQTHSRVRVDYLKLDLVLCSE